MADKSQPQTPGRSACQHHWVIDPPEGPVSKGVCRSCGEERDFLNYAERPYNTWDRNPVTQVRAQRCE